MTTVVALLIAGAVLSPERLCYIGIVRAPSGFRRWCARPWVARVGDPVAIVQRLFIGFKVVQLSLFIGWCYAHDGGWWRPSDQDRVVLAAATAAIVVGQFLVWTVFYRLGRVGVFYGDRLGHSVAWCHGFPFSLLSHPQYVGSVLTIWGFFLATRFPHDDWYLLPVLETVYYIVGAVLERPRERRRVGGGEGAATLSHDLG
jgi:methylene-fatty-acyl-phospholipid synthase